MQAGVFRDVERMVKETERRIAEMTGMQTEVVVNFKNLPVSRVPTVLRVVADTLDIRYTDLVGHSKRKEFVYARCIATRILRVKQPICGLELIGEVMGGRHHTTILHQYEKSIDLMRYEDFRDMYERCLWAVGDR